MRILPRTVAEPIAEPVTLAQIKDQVRVDDNVEDAELLRKAIAARRFVEGRLNRPIVPRTVRATFEAWPTDDKGIELLMPVTSVDAITFASTDVAAAPWTGSWVTRTSPGDITRVRPRTGDAYPSLGIDPVITLDATAGFAVTPDDVIEAVLMATAHFYVNREAVMVGGNALEIAIGVRELLRPYRWQWMG